MSVGNPHSLAAPAGSPMASLNPFMQRALHEVPAGISSEEANSDGRALAGEDMSLSRSPGIFTCTIRSDRQALWIGEDWVGLGESEATGGLEGCSEEAPGLVFLSTGQMMPVGGIRPLEAETIVTEAGSAGRTIILALIPPVGTDTIVYHSVKLSATVSDHLEEWQDMSTYIPSEYSSYYAVPIALVFTEIQDATYYVTDIFWTLEAPAVTVGGGGGGGSLTILRVYGLHPDSPTSGVRMYTGSVYGNGSNASATETGVTIRIPGIAADVETLSYGSWLSLGFCGGALVTSTWVGATQTHTDDSVYEAVGLLLLL